MDGLEGLREALEADKALSLGQCQRHWSIDQQDLGLLGFLTVETRVGLTRHQSPRPVVFVCSSPSIARLHPNQLRHLAGVAEMRHLLEASPDCWHSEAEREKALLYPDAVWQTPEGSVAVEFDAGSYSPRQIEQKMWRFARGHVAQVWGTPSAVRQARLRRRLKELGGAEVLLARWG